MTVLSGQKTTIFIRGGEIQSKKHKSGIFSVIFALILDLYAGIRSQNPKNRTRIEDV